MKKHVWIMNHYASGMYFEKGGRHYNFAKYLKQAGYEPVVFCANSKHGPPETWFPDSPLWQEHPAEEIGVPFVFIKARTYTGNGKQRILNMIDFYRNVKKAAREYAAKNGKPDVIYASSVHPLTLVAGIQLAKRFGVKCVCEVRDLWPAGLVVSGFLKQNSFLAKLLYAGEKWIYKKADSLIFTMEGAYDYIMEKGWGEAIPRSKVHHINNGVDLDTFICNREKHRVEDEDLTNQTIFKAVYAGSIRQVNRVGMLVDAAEILEQRGLKNIRILIWGDGNEREELQRRVQEKGLSSVCFKGVAKKAEISSILSQANITILHNTYNTLYKYGQSQNKFFEYLASGKPVFMTFSVDYSICRARGCGIELEEQTPEAIADALEWFTSLSEEKYQAYAQNAENVAKDYDFKILTGQLIEILERAE